MIFIMKTCPCNIQRFLSVVKIENFIGKKSDIFNIFAQNIHCGYTLEPPRRGATIYVLSKNKKNIKIFLMKISIFTGEKSLCILHGRVFVMAFFLAPSSLSAVF